MISIEQMAEGYIQNVNAQIEQAKATIQENNNYLTQLEAHKQECLIELKAQRESAKSQPDIPEPNQTNVEEVKNENPFGNLG